MNAMDGQPTLCVRILLGSAADELKIWHEFLMFCGRNLAVVLEDESAKHFQAATRVFITREKLRAAIRRSPAAKELCDLLMEAHAELGNWEASEEKNFRAFERKRHWRSIHKPNADRTSLLRLQIIDEVQHLLLDWPASM